MNNLNWHEHIGHFKIKRECIPVGCVPPARYRTGGLSNRDPPGQRPSGQRPSGQRPPGQRPLPLDTDPSLWTETPRDRDPPTETLIWSCDLCRMLEQRSLPVNRMTDRQV